MKTHIIYLDQFVSIAFRHSVSSLRITGVVLMSMSKLSPLPFGIQSVPYEARAQEAALQALRSPLPFGIQSVPYHCYPF